MTRLLQTAIEPKISWGRKLARLDPDKEINLHKPDRVNHLNHNTIIRVNKEIKNIE